MSETIPSLDDERIPALVVGVMSATTVRVHLWPGKGWGGDRDIAVDLVPHNLRMANTPICVEFRHGQVVAVTSAT